MTDLRQELENTLPDGILVDGPVVDFQPLLDIVATLRSDHGCPWDRRQTHETLRRYIIEEAHETAEAIDDGDRDRLCEELGDMLLVIALHGQIAAEADTFTLSGSVRSICEKMVRRHPHVFGDADRTAEEVARNWHAIKASENKKNADRKTLLSGVPRSLPALSRAHAISSRAAAVGFDWEHASDVLPKIREECDELEQALADANVNGSNANDANRNAIAEELGDLLFSVANLARKIGVDPEAALHSTTRKFERRFGFIEQSLDNNDREVSDASLDELEALWQEAKNQE